MAKKNDGRGRPAGTFKYAGKASRAIASVLRKHGLTGGATVLAKSGVVVGGKKVKVSLSLPALGQLATREGVTFSAGRPRKAA